MYCQTCAAEIQPGLNYCNRCGAVVNASLTNRTETTTALVDLKSPVRTLGTAVTLTTLIGITIIFIALDGMSGRALPPELLGVLGAASLFVILVIDVMLIRILSRLVQLPVAAPAFPAQPRRTETREIHQPPAQTYMPASATDPLPVASVTDHTTRTFHPVYKEPHAKS
jgi:Na+-transporting methylmalonyl-CoA/oxaloacetate decarboxylase gamma subunit